MLWGLLSITPTGPGIDFESCMHRGGISQLTISGAYKQTEKEIEREGKEGWAKTKSVWPWSIVKEVADLVVRNKEVVAWGKGIRS